MTITRNKASSLWVIALLTTGLVAGCGHKTDSTIAASPNSNAAPQRGGGPMRGLQQMKQMREQMKK